MSKYKAVRFGLILALLAVQVAWGLPHPQPALSAPEFSGCGGVTLDSINADYEQQVVDLVNTLRAAHSLPPLKWINALGNSARYHAADMLEDAYLKNDTYDRVGDNLVWRCDRGTRIGKYYSSPLAENIAMNKDTPAQVVNFWMNNSDDQANLLSNASWEFGVGYYTQDSFRPYWVIDFGRRNNIYPLVINNDAASVIGRNVSLYLYGADDWAEMRLRNESGAWTSWMPFQSRLAWTLSAGVGTHTVNVELRSSTKTYAASDSIVLSTDVAPTLGSLPEKIVFYYSQADQRLTPLGVRLTPANTSTAVALNWATNLSGSGFSVSPATGTTPQAITITPQGFAANQTGITSATLAVAVTSPSDTLGTPRLVSLEIHVVAGPLQWIYLPMVTK